MLLIREWIVTNGLGGYASLNYQNNNSRKYHGLLIASLNPPTQRWVFVSNVFDRMVDDNKTNYLNDFNSTFSFDFFPSFTYDLGNVKLTKTFFMEHLKNTSVIRYKIECKKPVTMIHQPVVNSRHFYDVNKERYLNFEQKVQNDTMTVKANNVTKNLRIILRNSDYEILPCWEEFYYNKDRDRNESWIDNNFRTGEFSKSIEKSMEYYLVLTIEDQVDINPINIFNKELRRRKKILDQADLPLETHKLVLASDNFIVKRNQSRSVIAGYHWFGDWGRDTLISLPGLTLVTKRYDDAKKILLNMGKYCKNGLIPNAFMDRDSQPVYNTVDASLWYIDRVYQYLKYTDDKKFIQKIWPILESIIQHYKDGTEHNIFMDHDFLISHDPGLTWMDVKIDDFYPTPRAKKAVEIQALWYNSLRVMGILAELNKKNDYYSDLAKQVKKSFNNQYSFPLDVIDTGDTSFRPNQIFLVSLDFPIIDKTLQKKIVDEAEKKLVTPFGLRSLSPDHHDYKGKYLGDYNKDLAYHNGTVWPWLMGQFIKSFIKTRNDRAKYRKYAFQQFLKPMLQIFGDSWDGSIQEIFDGDPIYAPNGCIIQAWSVAEILRTWIEDIENIQPKYNNNLVNMAIKQ